MAKEPWQPDREELAWAAGFFDGEGCVYISHRHPPYQSIGITITQAVENSEKPKTPEVFERLQKALGFGSITGPYHKEDRKPFCMFTVYSFERVQAAIAMLWPFLSKPKKKQATIALESMRRYYERT